MNDALPPLSEELIEVLVPETLVPVMISSGYYDNFKKLIDYHCREKEADALQSSIKRFFNQEQPASEWEAHLYTMLQLSSDFENQARNAGFFKKISVKEFLELRINQETN